MSAERGIFHIMKRKQCKKQSSLNLQKIQKKQGLYIPSIIGTDHWFNQSCSKATIGRCVFGEQERVVKKERK